MVAMASTVTVRGEGMARGRPDRYSIGLTVTRLEATPDAALEEVARRSAALEEAFTTVGLKSADWSSSGVSVRPESEWDAQRQEHRLRGHRATVQVMVAHDDPKLAARLVREAVQQAEAEVVGPSWTLSPSHPARAQACAEAARDAHRRAAAYAGALGLRVGAVAEVTEADLRPTPPPQPRAMMRAAAVSDSAPELNLDPGDADITAIVQVTFDLEPA